MEERLITCLKCKQELPESSFSKGKNKFGKHSYCKECDKRLSKERYRKKLSKQNTTITVQKQKEEKRVLHKVYKNPELAHFTNRQLLEEIKERGYTGKLYFTNEIQLQYIKIFLKLFIMKKRILFYYKHLYRWLFLRKYELSNKNKLIVLNCALQKIKNIDEHCLCKAIIEAIIDNIDSKSVYSYKMKHLYILIPKFNSVYLTGKVISYNEYWWDQYDRKSRITALNRLIKRYKKK